MTETDYAESWAWVHWLLETEPIRRTRVARIPGRLAANRFGACRFHCICDAWAAIRSASYSITCAGSTAKQ